MLYGYERHCMSHAWLCYNYVHLCHPWADERRAAHTLLERSPAHAYMVLNLTKHEGTLATRCEKYFSYMYMYTQLQSSQELVYNISSLHPKGLALPNGTVPSFESKGSDKLAIGNALIGSQHTSTN